MLPCSHNAWWCHRQPQLGCSHPGLSYPQLCILCHSSSHSQIPAQACVRLSWYVLNLLVCGCCITPSITTHSTKCYSTLISSHSLSPYLQVMILHGCTVLVTQKTGIGIKTTDIFLSYNTSLAYIHTHTVHLSLTRALLAGSMPLLTYQSALITATGTNVRIYSTAHSRL